MCKDKHQILKGKKKPIEIKPQVLNSQIYILSSSTCKSLNLLSSIMIFLFFYFFWGEHIVWTMEQTVPKAVGWRRGGTKTVWLHIFLKNKIDQSIDDEFILLDGRSQFEYFLDWHW